MCMCGSERGMNRKNQRREKEKKARWRHREHESREKNIFRETY